MPDVLEWPPKKEDLSRLYLEEHLSAAKIAKVYGLAYASPKTAESTVLYHLKRCGIQRRDKADHVRKITDRMVDEWVLRYKQGESLKKIAGSDVSPVSVWNHLRSRDVPLRDKIEAQIKAVTRHERKPFDGSRTDEAYMVGFVKGDCQVIKHGRAVRVRTSTTHPAQAELFDDLFSYYGFVHRYPSPSELTGFEWHLEVDLHETFSFLYIELPAALEKYRDDKPTFLFFLSGFFDAEGSVLFHKKGERGGFELVITNMNLLFLQLAAVILRSYGYGPKVRLDIQKRDRGVKNGEDHIWRLVLVRSDEVRRLLGELKLKHREKQDQTEIALRLRSRPESGLLSQVKGQWSDLRSKIRQSRDSFVLEAKMDYLSRQVRVERAK